MFEFPFLLKEHIFFLFPSFSFFSPREVWSEGWGKWQIIVPCEWCRWVNNLSSHPTGHIGWKISTVLVVSSILPPIPMVSYWEYNQPICRAPQTVITSSEESGSAPNPSRNLNTSRHLASRVLFQRQLEFIPFLPLILEPQGMLPPEVVIINRTAVRVIWTAPSNPNGVVTEYSVYVNNQLYKTGINVPGSFILRDLSPFTIYDIQVRTLFFGG